jgi:hypothetical protein
MSDLAAFLRDRLAEDEQAARAATHPREAGIAAYRASLPLDMEPLNDETAANWWGGTNEDGRGNYWCGVWAGDGLVSILRMDDEYDRGTAEHIARWDPARVLAEVEAKRAILRHEDVHGEGDYVLQALAQPYAGHPDFDPAWRTG